MAGGNDDFGEIGAVAAHRFGEAGIDRFAGIVVGAVQEEHRESEFASVLCPGGIGDVGGGTHVPGVGAEKAVADEGGGIDREVVFRDDVRVSRDRGCLVCAADAPRQCGRVSPCGRIAFAEERTDSAFDVGFERGAGTLEIFS